MENLANHFLESDEKRVKRGIDRVAHKNSWSLLRAPPSSTSRTHKTLLRCIARFVSFKVLKHSFMISQQSLFAY